MPALRVDFGTRAELDSSFSGENTGTGTEPLSTGASAGVTVGATIGGVLLVAVGMAAVFVLVRRRRGRTTTRTHTRARGRKSLKRSDTILSFHSRGDLDDDVDALLEKERKKSPAKYAHMRTESAMSDAPLLAQDNANANSGHRRTDSESSSASTAPPSTPPSRPPVPRIDIPFSPGLPPSTAFRGTMPPDSALLSPSNENENDANISSACMSSASPHSAAAAFALSAFAHPRAGTPDLSMAAMPIRTVDAARTAVAERIARSGAMPSTTSEPTRHQSLYPIPGGPPSAGSALMELPSPFIFKSPSALEDRDRGIPISPLEPSSCVSDSPPSPDLDTRTLDAAQLSEVIAAANWQWSDAPGARATIAVHEQLEREASASAAERVQDSVPPLQLRDRQRTRPALQPKGPKPHPYAYGASI
ncbi:hypothetical protein MKEN_01338800 [Mycena kentingensis (nom. inval.)]|nr:hypothetical protein MKEN_01338800 [Mycena kentingensis (nom. inval.)]